MVLPSAGRRGRCPIGSVSIWVSLATWLDTRADHWAAAAMYQQLSLLSDAELARRGLSRATLARDVLAASHAASRLADGVLQRRELTRGGLAFRM